MTGAPATPNAQQADYWNNLMGRTWAALQARTDELFAPLTEVAIGHAAPRAGERAIDIGCGCGATVLELARGVGPGGHVLGVDISAPMLEIARGRVAAAGLVQVTLTLADMASHEFAPQDFDLAFSRFGVMFFDDPAAAFGNLRRALKPSGRLVFACFRPMAENPWVTVPFGAVKHLLPPSLPPGPEEPGQFAFADPDRVRRILRAAGFRDIGLVKHDPAMKLAGPGEAARAAAFSSQIGPAARALIGAPEELKTSVREALEAEYRRHEGPDGIVLPGAIWIVSARP